MVPLSALRSPVLRHAVSWTDENPFESREIAVEAADDAGNLVRDKVTLPPHEIADEDGGGPASSSTPA